MRRGESRCGLPRGLMRYRAAGLEPVTKGAPRESGALVRLPLARCALVAQLGLQKEGGKGEDHMCTLPGQRVAMERGLVGGHWNSAAQGAPPWAALAKILGHDRLGQ